MFHDPLAEQKFAELQRQFGFDTCIETGTHCGHGALSASRYCKNVITIEIQEGFRMEAVNSWRSGSFVVPEPANPTVAVNGERHITSFLGNSPEVLDAILPSLRHEYTDGRRVCFYLDAHWGAYWPLRDELKMIAKHVPPGGCVIIIHDFKVPGKDWGFDNHGGRDLDFDYVGDLMTNINPHFVVFYNERAEGNRRGILYAVPTIK
jgi:hypothetical protein